MTMAVAGIVIGVIGGIDRLDGLTHSQVFSALPDWSTRAAAALSLGIGAALVTRFLLDVVPAAVTGRRLLGVSGGIGVDDAGTAPEPVTTGQP